MACPCFLALKEIEQVLLQKMPRPDASRFSDVTKGVLHFLQFTVIRFNMTTSMLNFNIKQNWRTKGGGVVLPGLVRRRVAEKVLFLSETL